MKLFSLAQLVVKATLNLYNFQDSIIGQFGFNFENDLMKKDRRQVFFCPVANCSRNQTSKNYFTRKSFLKLVSHLFLFIQANAYLTASSLFPTQAAQLIVYLLMLVGLVLQEEFFGNLSSF